MPTIGRFVEMESRTVVMAVGTVRGLALHADRVFVWERKNFWRWMEGRRRVEGVEGEAPGKQ